MRYTHVLGSHDIHILVGQVYAVRSNGTQLKHAQLIHQLNRCHAMLFDNGINLKFSFAQMHLDFCLVGSSLGNNLFQIINRTSIRSVRTVGDADTAIVIALPVLRQHSVFCQLYVLVRRYADQAAAEVSADAGFGAGTRNILHEGVHICKAGSTALQHFYDAQHCAPVDVVSIHLVFNRPDFVLQPVHKRHVIGIAAQQRHRNVAMGVDHAGSSQFALAVHDFVGSKVCRHVLAYINNLIIFNGDILHFTVRSMQKLDILNQ
ncbi:unknown [Phascolarctobacterium succinatutens CAG:287]|uniref:Uncharacterized protein n=1 Tax=Phascolarctobacterium succinatutens CAG:287 TaxID=1263101 RepID=R6WUW4_9FIRM|nr:unknown [Phascolarctobacterium succinatutens CAG:287]